MTAYEEPPIVDLDELLDEQEPQVQRVTGRQWLLVIGGGIVGLVGLMALLVATSPGWLQLIRILSAFGVPADPAP